MPLARLILLGALLILTAVVLSQGAVMLRFEYVLGLFFAVAVFAFVFVKTEVGLYLVLFSMLLSPELTVGAQTLAEMRQGVVFRLEDVLLVVIAFSWLAKTALNKEMGLVVKTPLNRPIMAYIATTFIATLLGYVVGSVKTAAGFFYVLKYVEYFIVYYMTTNYLRDREQAWRLVLTAFLTATIVSVIGIAQIPSGQRVTAPFEGDSGEPNTFGGYLLLMMAIVAGLALETRHIRTRVWSAVLLALMTLPFLFTLSRASYLGFIPVVAVLAVLSTRRKLAMTLLAFLLAASPLFLTSLRTALPGAVVRRVAETFQPQAGQPQVRLGRVGFDPSTSERLLSMRYALTGWMKRPFLGYGVTGFAFMDAQYARTLVEVGLVGLAAFLALLWAVLKGGMASLRSLTDVDDRGLVLGFIAGTVGLLVHAVGSNTFIIIRIMEPFWFFAAVVMVLPTLQKAAGQAGSPPPVVLGRASAV